MKKVQDFSYGNESEAQKLNVYFPEESARAVFVYFHGGGLERGDKISAERFADYLTERGIIVVSANYRMYPEAKYPDFIRDAAMAVRWTKDNLESSEIYVGGSSAGGYISMMLCFNPEYLCEVGLSSSDVSGYFHDAGQPTAHFRVLKEMGVDSRKVIVDRTAPLYFVGNEASYPPMRFIVSDNDMENRYEQTMLMVSTMRHFGYEGFDYTVMENSTHCSYCGKRDEKGESVFGKMICDFICRK